MALSRTTNLPTHLRNRINAVIVEALILQRAIDHPGPRDLAEAIIVEMINILHGRIKDSIPERIQRREYQAFHWAKRDPHCPFCNNGTS